MTTTPPTLQSGAPAPFPGPLPGAVPGAASSRKKRNRRRKIIGGIVVALFGLGVGYTAAEIRHGDLFANPFADFGATRDYNGPGEDEVAVTIPAGATGTMMGQILHENGVVASVRAFTDAFTANPESSRIGPGTFRMYTQMSGAQAVDQLIRGERVEVRVVIPEGFTVEQIIARFDARTDISREQLEAAIADPASIGLPDVAAGNPEGWLFPATYTIYPGTTAQGILTSMVSRTIQELDRLGVPEAEREIVLNKASLVEREVRNDGDKPRVARAINNRLDIGMPLQIDAAVAYGLGISGTQLTRAHLQDSDNLFNTYQHTGLPPAPIPNPGAASIDAVMNPADGPWLFWVTVNLDTGETIFTSTYAEHQRYVAQLREWQAANPR
ncbi:MAG: endolytic transglycosylase MltG [Cellulomonadaceae bacterium]|nr:endolytic transglycosylase MltG [Cellulomonadaceae bacterium]